MTTSWFLYLLECNNGAYYAGISNDVKARFATHVSGKGARYTRANPPVKILATKTYADRSAASVAEAQLKSLPRNKKLQYFNESHVE
ncbi:MAG: GIY-YIG nuclease family protein [Methylotenera sp.]|uniref:GIY-YIG nuclease family protein n=1 Tax=Methylotenera sp. TaxID=2051956 RepID=UPI00248988C7|nr:GIY-YIG nuclease family protein [Methylotenera sp.]MDI1308249.1 GIY-YIG nuclease family protein [Methylotenera sp.]